MRLGAADKATSTQKKAFPLVQKLSSFPDFLISNVSMSLKKTCTDSNTTELSRSGPAGAGRESLDGAGGMGWWVGGPGRAKECRGTCVSPHKNVCRNRENAASEVFAVTDSRAIEERDLLLCACD